MLPKAFFLKHKYRLDIVTYFSNLNTWEVETGGWEGQSFPQLTLSQKKAVVLLHLCYCCGGGVCLCLSHDTRGGAMVWQLGKSGYSLISIRGRDSIHDCAFKLWAQISLPPSGCFLSGIPTENERGNDLSDHLTGDTLTILLLFSS